MRISDWSSDVCSSDLGTQALLVPGLVALEDLDEVAVEDWRLHHVERGKHPCDRACPGIGIVRQQAGMTLGDMEHDRPRLEQGEIAFFNGRNLPERLQRAMRTFLHTGERKKTHVRRWLPFINHQRNNK